MGLIGQVALARAGTALELEFDVEDLKNVVENRAKPFGHVTMHPGDFTGLDEEIQVPEGVSITILPGADVEYTDSFRDPGCPDDCAVFDHKGSGATPNDSSVTHPLTEDFKRYERPEFTGHVENIADLNLASEWALEATPQLWTAARAGADAEIDVLAGDADEDLRTLSFRGGPGAEVAVQENTREIQISLDPEDFVRSLNFNRLLFEESNQSVGDLSVSHEGINTEFNVGVDETDPTGGARILRSLSIHESEPAGSQTAEPDGHVDTVEEANLIAGTGVSISVIENPSSPDEIEIDASGAAGSGVTSISTGSDLEVDQSTGAVTISHDVNSDESIGNSGGNVIQEVETSSGHVTSVSTTNLDNRYVEITGDTMTGTLTIEGFLGFDTGTPVETIRTSVRSGGNENDNTLVTEAGIRTAINNIVSLSGASFSTSNPDNELTLSRNNASDLNVVIRPGEIFHDDQSVAVSTPDGDTVRVEADSASDPVIIDISNSTSRSAFSNAPNLGTVNFDEEISSNSSMVISSSAGDKELAITAQNDSTGTNPALVMNHDGDGDAALTAFEDFTFDFENANEDKFPPNNSSGVYINTNGSNFSVSNTRIVLSSLGFIDIPTRDNSEPDPGDPPDGYVRVFARGLNNGAGAEVVFLEASGGTSVLDPN